jgi:hypothetical protein
VSDQQRVAAALGCFMAGTILTAAVSVVVGMAMMVVGLAALLWGRNLGNWRR